MNHVNHNASYGAQKSAEATQSLHDDIRARWERLSDFDVGALTGAADLVAQVARLYAIDLEQAQNDVSSLLDGRTI